MEIRINNQEAGGKSLDHVPALTDASQLNFSDSITVEAWIESHEYRAEAMQAVVSKWRSAESFDRFDAYDAANTDGLDTRGFFGAVFDGRYVYFVPQNSGAGCAGRATGHHGNVLRYDSHNDFKAASSWRAYDASNTSGLQTRGYYGAVFDGRYVFFIPRTDGIDLHTRMLRLDTHGDFTSPDSWLAYDVGHAMSCQSAGFDGRYIYCCPGYEADPKTDHCGLILRYDTQSPVRDPQSYCVHDTGGTGGLDASRMLASSRLGCFDGAVFDGRYMYFTPLGGVAQPLRYDTTAEFRSTSSWEAFDAAEVSGLKMGTCVGATFDGQYIYFVQYANTVSVRFDTTGNFTDAEAWSAFDATGTSGLTCSGYDGAIFDGRYVYFIPFWEGEDPGYGFHGNMLRYDTQGDFADSNSWQAVDAGKTSDLSTVGFNGGAFDGRFIYMAPWRCGTTDGGDPIAHGNVLRYDTVGENASFSLRAVDFGHNGGLCAAVPGPSFLVNTERGVLNVRANRNLSPGRHYLAGVYDGRKITLYIDGVAVAEQNGSGRIQACDAQIAIGRIEDGRGDFGGHILDVGISSAARDADWVAARYDKLSDSSA